MQRSRIVNRCQNRESMPELQVQKKVKNKEKREWKKEIHKEKKESNLIKIAFSLLIKSLLLLYSSRLKLLSFLIRFSLCLQFCSSFSLFWHFKRIKRRCFTSLYVCVCVYIYIYIKEVGSQKGLPGSPGFRVDLPGRLSFAGPTSLRVFT
jgi:hypothetical protein